ncbi:MAG: PadR family transcriptional regulator [Gemmatimonadales bacterium]
MDQPLRHSAQTAAVLGALLHAPRAWRHGYDLSRETDLKSGTLYPILMRLSDGGMLDAKWEPSDGGRPPRHLYRLAPSAIPAARAYLLRAAPRGGRVPALRGAEG